MVVWPSRSSEKTLPRLSSVIVSDWLGRYGAAVVCFPYHTSAWFHWGVSQWGPNRCLWGHAASPRWRDAPEFASTLQSPHQCKDLPGGKSHHRYCVYDCTAPLLGSTLEGQILFWKCSYLKERFLCLSYFIQDMRNFPLLCICFQSESMLWVLPSVIT